MIQRGDNIISQVLNSDFFSAIMLIVHVACNSL